MMEKVDCDHCGDHIVGNAYSFEDKKFCCSACRNVYKLLIDNNLSDFYNFQDKSGVKPSESDVDKFSYLEIDSISKKYIDFENETIQKVNLFLPEIHCSSCIYLLENLKVLLPGVLISQVVFTKREANITFNKNELTLADLARFLDKIGYSPNFGNRKEVDKKVEKTFLYKLGVAGFAFGSIMLWSFPEYLGIEGEDNKFRILSSFLSLGVSIPVLLYSARDYFVSAYKALKAKQLNLDVPITLGIIALYIQSVYSILTLQGPGYMDSFAGFIFFLLIGKWFQNRTYKSLTFERDYTSYFPVAVTRVKNGVSEIVEIEKIQVGDEIVLRNQEIIPCDCVLLSDTAKIDFSFVTGESEPVYMKKGDFIYAGGKLMGKKIILEVKKESNRSHLTQIWNQIQKDSDDDTNRFKFQDQVARYFLFVVIIIAIISGIVWSFIDITRVTEIVVAILIVACPCALALSSPFTYGNVMRLMGRNGLYVKNTSMIEKFNGITDIVFDKTGTLTETSTLKVGYVGDKLEVLEQQIVFSLANSSTHPLSRNIAKYIHDYAGFTDLELDSYEEFYGKGTRAFYQGIEVKIGNSEFVNGTVSDSKEMQSYFDVNGKKGKFVFYTELREGISDLLKQLDGYNLHMLSGDNDKDRILFEQIFSESTQLIFNQTPQDKLNYVELLKSKGKKVMMIGDGLNDTGALASAELGIAVSEDVFRFTPSSDAIIKASELKSLKYFLELSLHAKRVLIICLIFSLCYNLTGLAFAVSGHLTPLVAAIIMPLSSITIVLLSTFLVMYKVNK